MNFGIYIFLIFIYTFSLLFCTYFSASLAKFKGRTKSWGIIGFLFLYIGLIIVCFLPSKRDDKMQTNPIISFFSKLPSMSRKTIGLIVAIVVVISLTLLAYDKIPKIIENKKYSKEITLQNTSIYKQPQNAKIKISNIFVGNETSFVITDLSDAYCWGKQHIPHIENEQDGIVYKNAKKILANDNISFVLTSDSKLYGFGQNIYNLLLNNEESDSPVLIFESVRDFDISDSNVAIITNDNKLYMYGNNTYGQLGTGDTLPREKPTEIMANVKSVSCESSFTVVLTQDGTVFGFGNNFSKQFGVQDPIVLLPKGIAKGIMDIASGDRFILLLKTSGELVACGNNAHAQLGIESEEPITTFSAVMNGVKKVCAAKSSSFAITNDGELYAWGYNNVGQLGAGKEEIIRKPIVIDNNIASVDTSGLHTIILNEKGNVLSTGYNSCSQLGRGKSRNEFATLVNIK